MTVTVFIYNCTYKKDTADIHRVLKYLLSALTKELLLSKTLLTCILSSTESSHQLRVSFKIYNLELEYVLNCLFEAFVLCTAAC